VIFSIAILYHDIGKHHDSTNLLLHLSLLLNASTLIGVVIWLADQWKYFRIIFWVVFEVVILSLIIEYFYNRSFLQAASQVCVFLFVMYLLKQEYIKLKSLRSLKYRATDP
jgi:hypothetical protein